MKKLILMLTVTTLCTVCKAQLNATKKIDSCINSKLTAPPNSFNDVGIITIGNVTAYKDVFDTVSCVMLVTDTALNTSMYVEEASKGYSLTRYYQSYSIMGYARIAHYGMIVEYLDDKRTPLRPSIIVWESK